MKYCFLPIMVFIFLSACKNNDKKIPEGYSKLTVVIDSGENFFLNEVTAELGDSKYLLENRFDDNRKDVIYIYNKVKNNEYNIQLSSHLDRTYSFPLTLVKDTIIFIDKSQLQNFDNMANEDYRMSDLQINDTISFGYAQYGCWGRYFDFIRIIKKEKNFSFEIRTDTAVNNSISNVTVLKHELPLNFTDSIAKLEKGLLAVFKTQQNNKIEYSRKIEQAKTATDSGRLNRLLYNTSTLSKVLYVVKGDQVYTFWLWGDEKNEDCYASFWKSLKPSFPEIK